MTDRLRPHWNFDDLEGTEKRFGELLQEELTETGRAELLTQVARVEGLREDFVAGEGLLNEAERLSREPIVRIRVDLERGRLRRSEGDKKAALPFFESAFATALENGEDWLAADAAHMCALAAPDSEGFLAWTQRGIALAESSEAAAYWLGPLLNNLGWELFEAGEHEEALGVFERALIVRERDPENLGAIEAARAAVTEARRALGR